MTFKRTTPITALDLDPSDLPDASASSKGGVTLTQLDKWRRRNLPRPNNVDAVMSSPPTIGTPSTSSGITSGVLVKSVTYASGAALLNSRYLYRGGGGWTNAGTSFPDRDYIKATSLTSPSIGTAPYAVDFMHDGTSFEIFVKGTGAAIRMRVNGELVTVGSTVTPTNNGSQYYVPVTFGSSAIRRISLEFGNAVLFGGININPTDSLWKPEARGPRVVVMGDSFTEGSGGTISQGWWGRKMSEALGWYDVSQSGVGATGYLNPGTGGKVKFRDRVTNDVINLNPDIVVIAGGINDSGAYSAAAIGTEAAALFSAIKTALPNVILIVTSPFWKAGVGGWASNTVALLDTRDALRTAAQAAGGYFIDVLEMPMDTNVAAPVSTTLSNSPSAGATTFTTAAVLPRQSTVQIGTGATRERRVITNVSGAGPYTITVKALTNAHSSGETVVQVGDCHWTGTGAVGTTQNDGNCDLYVSADFTHPSTAGHDALGLQIARLIAETVLAA